jgi:hypothetical protein
MEKANIILNYEYSDVKESLNRELEKEKVRSLSISNIHRINAIQELIFHEEDNELSVNEVLEHVLKFYPKFVPYKIRENKLL